MKKQPATKEALAQQAKGEKMIRKPIISVLGHVDHGKTKLLDRIRGTTIAEKEAGSITQHIGATEVPIEIIKRVSGDLIHRFGFKIIVPGLLFIDTPGHEAFTNLRKRGGSIADLAILVVDSTQGVQAQTSEAIEILKNYKTPFIVALNKIDKLAEWNSREGSFIQNIESADESAKKKLDEKLYELVGKLHSFGFNSERFDRCKDFSKQIPIVPVSAVTGEGIPEILMLLVGLSQKFLKDRLEIDEKERARGTVLEVGEEKGLGTTIDLILYEGMLSIGMEIVVAGKRGAIETKVRNLLVPSQLEEIRDSTKKFKPVHSVAAAAGVKIVAPALEEALPGSPFLVVNTGREKELIMKEIESLRVDSTEVGVVVKTDTLGSLEALVGMLLKDGITVRKADVGNVTKKDVMEALSVREKEPLNAVIIAFSTGIEASALEEAKKREIKIFKENVIYSLLEKYKKWIEEQKGEIKKKGLKELVYPFKFKVLKGHIFRKSNPAIVGIRVLEGKIKAGTNVFSKKKKVGTIESIQSKGQSLELAEKNSEVAVSISGAVVGRNLRENDILYSYIPKKQFNAIEKTFELTEEEKSLFQEIIKKQEETKAEDKPI